MTQKMKNKSVHPVAEMYAREHKNGDMDRREFISRSTALGVTAAGAYGLIGCPTGTCGWASSAGWNNANANGRNCS